MNNVNKRDKVKQFYLKITTNCLLNNRSLLDSSAYELQLCMFHVTAKHIYRNSFFANFNEHCLKWHNFATGYSFDNFCLIRFSATLIFLSIPGEISFAFA